MTRDARFARIETPRLICEPLAAEHAQAMFPLLSDPRIYAYMPREAPESVEALERRYRFLSGARSPDGREHWLNWILFARASGAAIGFTQATVRPASCSIAYVLSPANWGRGLASEAVEALLASLFGRYEVAAIQAEIHAANRASSRLVQRLGFVRAREDLAAGDDVYELTRDAWRRR